MYTLKISCRYFVGIPAVNDYSIADLGNVAAALLERADAPEHHGFVDAPVAVDRYLDIKTSIEYSTIRCKSYITI